MDIVIESGIEKKSDKQFLERNGGKD